MDGARYEAAGEFLACLLTDAFCVGVTLTKTADAICSVVLGVAQSALHLEDKRE